MNTIRIVCSEKRTIYGETIYFRAALLDNFRNINAGKVSDILPRLKSWGSGFYNKWRIYLI